MCACGVELGRCLIDREWVYATEVESEDDCAQRGAREQAPSQNLSWRRPLILVSRLSRLRRRRIYLVH